MRSFLCRCIAGGRVGSTMCAMLLILMCSLAVLLQLILSKFSVSQFGFVLAIVIHLWVSNVFVAVPTVQKMFPRSVVLKRFGPGTRISF